MKHKNPFKGIACSNGSAYGPKFFRRVEGARDYRPSFLQRRRGEVIIAMISGEYTITPFRDTNPHPVSFAS